MDHTELTGGLRRMIDRLHEEGTATKVEEADDYLRESANAVLIGMLLDQRVLAEIAFCGPLKIKQRIGHLDYAKIAKIDAEKFGAVFSEKPAIHRFVNMMAGRTQKLCQFVVDNYDGDATKIWEGADDPKEFTKRVVALPGFGPDKAKKLKHALHIFGHRQVN